MGLPRKKKSRLPSARPAIPRTERSSKPEPPFPANFPAYHSTQNMNEIAAYLANASYVVALGGPPLADLKYGIVIVPAGEEGLLFGRPPDFAISQAFIDAIDDANRDYDRALRMHDPDKDIEEYACHRFDDDFPPVPPEAQRRVEAVLPAQPAPPREPSQEARQEDRPVVQSASPKGVQQQEQQQQQQHRQPSAPKPRPKAAAVPIAAAPKKPSARKTAVSPPPGRVGKKDAPRPQRVEKLRRSSRLAVPQMAGGNSQQAGAKKARKATGRE
jgi:hypothetical protein